MFLSYRVAIVSISLGIFWRNWLHTLDIDLPGGSDAKQNYGRKNCSVEVRRPKIRLPPVGPLLYSSCKVIAIANLPVARCSRFSSCMVLSSCMVVASVRVAILRVGMVLSSSTVLKILRFAPSSACNDSVSSALLVILQFAPCSAHDSSICPVLCSDSVSSAWSR